MFVVVQHWPFAESFDHRREMDWQRLQRCAIVMMMAIMVISSLHINSHATNIDIIDDISTSSVINDLDAGNDAGDDYEWQPQVWIPPTVAGDFAAQSVSSTTDITIRVGSGSAVAPIELTYCSVPYVSIPINVTNNASLASFGDITFDTIDGSYQFMWLPAVTTSLSSLTYIIQLQCFDNYTTATNMSATYTYIVDPPEIVNISRPIITTVYGDSSTYSITVTCNGGSGSHQLYVTGSSESLILANQTSYTFTISSSVPTAIARTYTCSNALTSQSSTASEQFVFNVDGCITLATGSLNYCEGSVLYPIDSRIDILEADNRAQLLYENDAYNHWNATGWLPSPNITLVYDNATGTYQNVSDTVVTISSNCLAFRRRLYCAQQFPYCLQSVWPSYQSGPCRGICSQVISAIRCGSDYDGNPRCVLLQTSSWAAPTSQASTATQVNAVTGHGEFIIPVRSYDDGLCAAAHHTISIQGLPSMIIMMMVAFIITWLTR